MNKPIFTIITVSFNAKSTIEESILSVINQTYPYIEYIIIDGGSTDGTIDIIKKYDKYLAYWISEPDKGIYDAMNKGIEKATGKWINFMNAGDTFYDNNVIEYIAQQVDDNIDIIFGNTHLIYTFGDYILKGGKVSSQQYMPFCHQSSFSCSKLMKRYGFDLTYKICADKNFFYIAYNNHAIYKYVDMMISNYEAEDGISANNLHQATYEMGLIEGKTHLLQWKLKYLSILVYSNILNLAKRILPTFIFQFIRKQKVKSFTEHSS